MKHTSQNMSQSTGVVHPVDLDTCCMVLLHSQYSPLAGLESTMQPVR